MSIVGPRPALPREVEQYGEYEKQRLYVTPGLSCYERYKRPLYQYYVISM